MAGSFISSRPKINRCAFYPLLVTSSTQGSYAWPPMHKKAGRREKFDTAERLNPIMQRPGRALHETMWKMISKGEFQPPSQGLTSGNPKGAKSLTLRVTSVWLCARGDS
jgi:hypothetical protein